MSRVIRRICMGIVKSCLSACDVQTLSLSGSPRMFLTGLVASRSEAATSSRIRCQARDLGAHLGYANGHLELLMFPPTGGRRSSFSATASQPPAAAATTSTFLMGCVRCSLPGFAFRPPVLENRWRVRHVAEPPIVETAMGRMALLDRRSNHRVPLSIY